MDPLATLNWELGVMHTAHEVASGALPARTVIWIKRKKRNTQPWVCKISLHTHTIRQLGFTDTCTKPVNSLISHNYSSYCGPQTCRGDNNVNHINIRGLIALESALWSLLVGSTEIQVQVGSVILISNILSLEYGWVKRMSSLIWFL